jgi:hypothetical protein
MNPDQCHLHTVAKQDTEHIPILAGELEQIQQQEQTE